MSRTAIYPGTFDPLTLGHLDIIARAAALFDRLVVGVFTNAAKSPLFSLDERLAIARREVTAVSGAIAVEPCSGLIVDIAAGFGATAIVRGLRNGTDFDYEAQMTGMNRAMAPAIDTVFLLAEPRLQPIASSLVKDVARAGGDVSHFVTAAVAADIAAKLGSKG